MLFEYYIISIPVIAEMIHDTSTCTRKYTSTSTSTRNDTSTINNKILPTKKEVASEIQMKTRMCYVYTDALFHGCICTLL